MQRSLLSLLLASVSFFALAQTDVPRDVANLNDAKQAVVRYHDSGRWDRDTWAVVHRAEHWIGERAKKGGKLAMVLDIDETALLNWPEEKLMDFGFVASMWGDWEKAGKAPASPEVLDLFKYAKAHGVSVFFVTGRHETSRDGTAKNLADVGYTGYVKLVMKPDTYHEKSVIGYKSGARADIEKQGFRIIANVGDQWSDLRGGHSEKTFKVPNPMYLIP